MRNGHKACGATGEIKERLSTLKSRWPALETLILDAAAVGEPVLFDQLPAAQVTALRLMLPEGLLLRAQKRAITPWQCSCMTVVLILLG